MAKKKGGGKRAAAAQAPSYVAVKTEAIQILDDNTTVALVPQYGAQYNAKTALYKGLGIGPERMWAMAPTVNKRLRRYSNFRPVTSAAMASCEQIGEFIELYCGGARASVPSGEPS